MLYCVGMSWCKDTVRTKRGRWMVGGLCGRPERSTSVPVVACGHCSLSVYGHCHVVEGGWCGGGVTAGYPWDAWPEREKSRMTWTTNIWTTFYWKDATNAHQLFNPFNASCSKLLRFKRSSGSRGPPTIFIFWHSGALALSPERQSARMSKIKNGRLEQYGKV